MNEFEDSFADWFKIISSFESIEEVWEADDDLLRLPPKVTANFLQALFVNAPTLCANISGRQLSAMIWFFNGHCSGYWGNVRSKSVPTNHQAATVSALGNFYRDFLDLYFLSGRTDRVDAEQAVYMMWDMDCLEGAAMFPGEEYLIEPIFQVLGIALRCKSSPCQKSALHGLGHLERYHPVRVHKEIDWSLKQSGHLEPILVEYAKQARTGLIQ